MGYGFALITAINLDADEELDEKERKVHFLEDRCDTIHTAIRKISTNSEVVALKKEAAQDNVEDTKRFCLFLH